MKNHLISKLEQFARLSQDEKDILNVACAEEIRKFQPREDIFREGDRPTTVNVMLAGWACRYKYLEDGRRQIMSFFIPGDVCDFNIFILREMDHSLSTITPVTVAELRRNVFERITENCPRITQALWWETLVNVAIQREWTVNLGQRDAMERIAHLFCELFLRLQGVGLTSEDSCEMPLTQADLADATGLSVVHVNRTLQELRAAKLIVLRGKTLLIPDLKVLMDMAMFNANYLHLSREGKHLDANG